MGIVALHVFSYSLPEQPLSSGMPPKQHSTLEIAMPDATKFYSRQPVQKYTYEMERTFGDKQQSGFKSAVSHSCNMANTGSSHCGTLPL
jgi:hypothetical protein